MADQTIEQIRGTAEAGTDPNAIPKTDISSFLTGAGYKYDPAVDEEAQMWQYEVNGNYQKGACCSNEDCPLDNPGRSFEAATKREARCLWNKRA